MPRQEHLEVLAQQQRQDVLAKQQRQEVLAQEWARHENLEMMRQQREAQKRVEQQQQQQQRQQQLRDEEWQQQQLRDEWRQMLQVRDQTAHAMETQVVELDQHLQEVGADRQLRATELDEAQAQQHDHQWHHRGGNGNQRQCRKCWAYNGSGRPEV